MIKSSPTPVINNSLSFSPIDQTILPGQINSLNIILQSQNNNNEAIPNTIQLEIAYDPNAISNVSIQSGDFFQNPLILINTINEHSGRISYALEKSPSDSTIKALGTVATLSFIPNVNFTNNYSPIKFLEKTLIRGKNGENILTSTTSANIIFKLPIKP